MTPLQPTPCRRGWPAQRNRRETEHRLRHRAVAFVRWARRRGFSQYDVADRLGVPTRTLAHWQHRWRCNDLTVQPRGRPAHRGDVETRNAAIHLMTQLGPGTSLTTLRAACPTLARGELQDLQRRYRRLWRRDHRRLLHVLHWHRPGAVWAMDHTDPPQPIEGRWPHILAVRDLASRMQLGWIPVSSENASQTCHALELLFRKHGPPLVLKSDNGSGFISEHTQQLLKSWGVWPLFSPPRTPAYNGSCEAGNGAMKKRTHHQAILHDRPQQWAVADLEAARQIANCLHRPWGHRGPTAAEAWRKRTPLGAHDRAAFHHAVQHHQAQARNQLGYHQQQPLARTNQAQVDRLAIRRACVECGLLTFTQRSIAPPITTHFPANIS
jgi:transposase InsO family protein